MKSKGCIIGLGMVWALLVAAGCDQSDKSAQIATEFSKADSLTEIYLALQDTMLQVWNTMINDDNRKIRAMRNLLHELEVSNPENEGEFEGYDDRLEDLLERRYNQQSIAAAELVSEYDFASNSLITELISLAESQTEYAYNSTLQKLVESIQSADQRVMNYRAEYDDIALRFNGFIERNRHLLEDVHADSVLEKKPLFQMTSE